MSDCVFSFRGKNGQIRVGKDRQVYIGRKGWFGVLYQILTRGQTQFCVDDIEKIELQPPTWKRGYLRISTGHGSGTVWLTNEKMAQNARQAKSIVETMKMKPAEKAL